MRLQAEISVGVGALLAVQVFTSVAAIGLLARMAPAVERILDENVVTITATEDMLAVLARGEPGQDARFLEALERARANVTEPEELPLVAILDQRAGDALAGDPAARAETVDTLVALADVNRRSMERMDRHARGLGSAGAWSVVALGVLGFTLWTFVSRGLARRIGRPLAAIDATLAAAERGDRLRRCVVTDAPPELARIAREVNELLDARSRATVPPSSAGSELDRSALLALLDDADGPVAVVDAKGGLRAANLAAQDLLYGPDGVALRDALARVPNGEAGPAVVQARPFEGGWICRVAGSLSEPGSAAGPEAAPGAAPEG